jgi:hypothetical protein
MTQMNSVKEWKRNWLAAVGLYLKVSYPKIGDIEVVDDRTMKINQNIYKVDLNDYSGETEYYIFFNLTNGRMYLKVKDKVSIHRFDVDLIED